MPSIVQSKYLFIANRGEICRRIAHSAKLAGWKTATFNTSEIVPDYLAGLIDAFIDVSQRQDNPFLNASFIIEQVKALGCSAVHPGFGFLSENVQFAQACQTAGILWVGPNPKAMAAMASKETARHIAQDAGVPVNTAFEGIRTGDFDRANLMAFARNAGFPLLVKAAFGGGGKGMRLVEEEGQLFSAIERAGSEAASSFGDGLLLVEKYISRPRHVEVQVIADKHGNVYALGDRDCSLQRRHQKIIEEAPAPGLHDDTRQAMHAAAVNLARSVGYDSVGTVEFLVDASEPSSANGVQRFYFLEMNTRLQVEHPVTEEVFGVDLVDWQLKIAENIPLPDQFKSLTPRGHALEVRIYAEDPEHNFLPAPGLVYLFRPAALTKVRWEVGVDETDEVNTSFDPMIAKCIAWGETREQARQLLRQALDQTYLFGVKNNILFLNKCLSHPEFIAGGITTHFLTAHLENLINEIKEEKQSLQEEATLTMHHLQENPTGLAAMATDTTPAVTDAIRQAYCNNSEQPARTTLQQNDYGLLQEQAIVHRRHRRISISFKRFTLGNRAAAAALVYGPEGREIWLNLNGFIFHEKQQLEYNFISSVDSAQASHVLAPVPGKVVKIQCRESDKIQENTVVAVLESMKMEFEVRATREGQIAALHIEEGQQVAAGDLILTWSE